MRLAVIADVHGSLPALEAVLRDVDRQRADDLIMLGDFADRGPFPLEVVECLMARGGQMIQGNTDQQIVALARRDVPQEWLTSRQFASMRWTADRLNAGAVSFLAGLPEQRVVELPGCDPLRAVHGTPTDPSGALFPEYPHELVDTFAGLDEPVLLCGHSHMPWVWADNGRLAVNPGSVGQPFNGDLRAQYALLDWDRGAQRWRASLQAVAYDRERTRRAFTETGYLAESGAFGRACYVHFERARATIPLLLAHAYRLSGGPRYGERWAVPDDIWAQVEATFDWNTTLYWDPVTGEVLDEGCSIP